MKGRVATSAQSETPTWSSPSAAIGPAQVTSQTFPSTRMRNVSAAMAQRIQRCRLKPKLIDGESAQLDESG